jgi:LuxR family maltose regulon positive regulatory protein
MNAARKTPRSSKQRPTLLGKFTRPRPVGALARERLFRALDRARRHPAVWISGPPGAGKTTLISTYAEARGVPTLWYRVQADDADPATFFHYFGLAVEAAATRKGKGALPHLTPEYLLNLPVFSRRYFEQVFRRLPGPRLLVLDNYQEAAADAPLQEALRALLECLPEGVSVMVVSRGAPPPALAAPLAQGVLVLLDGEALKLSEKECGEIARLREIEIDKADLHRLYERTQGWTAGVVLALEQKGSAAAAPVPPPEATPQVLFDYFAGEIFAHMTAADRELLLRAAFLPGMAAARVAELTGAPGAERVLEGLARTNYFTVKLAAGLYQFHPLFREFLLKRAQETFNAETLAGIRIRAAALLEADGEAAEAVNLLSAASVWEEALRVMCAQAPHMLQQGRGRALEAWLRALPLPLREQSPWALYWLGRCRLGYAPVEARGYLEQAFPLFKRDDDAVGMFSAWSSIVDSYVFEWGEFASIDRWIDALDEMLMRHPVPPTPVIEARVAAGMFTALMYRRPSHPDLAKWAERVRTIVVNTTDGRTQMMLGNQLMHYYTSWVGDIAAARLLRSSVRRPANAADYGPLAYIAWCAMEADYHWNVGAHDECLRRMKDGLETTKETGALFATSRLDAHGVTSRIMTGDFAKADRYLKISAGNIPGARVVYLAHYHFLVFLSAYYQKDLLHSVASAREAVRLADAAGVPICRALYRLGLAYALFANGERREALSVLAQARSVARLSRIPTIELGCVSATAYFLLARGRTARALPWLRKALESARKGGEFNRVFWTPAQLARIFATALEHDIEPEYVEESIRRRKVAPPPEALHLENWPFPVRIHTLGRFSVLVDGKPLEFSGKAQRKPLELLMALIAFGGRDVSERQLTESLWPDAEGDAAHQACAVALHRLRKLIGSDEAITLQRNHFTLDPHHVWVDVWAFERGLARDGPLGKGAVGLYQGAFLGKHMDLPWAIPLRERLRVKFMRHLAERGRALFESGEHAGAVALFEKGLAADPLAEEFYRQLMVCYQAMDLRAEAIGVYRRCEKTLAASLGMPPAEKTVALYRTLLN